VLILINNINIFLVRFSVLINTREFVDNIGEWFLINRWNIRFYVYALIFAQSIHIKYWIRYFIEMLGINKRSPVWLSYAQRTKT